MKKKIILSGLIFSVMFAFASIAKINAAATDNVTGWLWGNNGNSSGIGWVSMNDINPEISTSGANYGVRAPLTDGNLSGHAWSEYYGWISFEASDVQGCPSGTCSARRSGNDIVGWARILSIKKAYEENNSGGWQGWISLKGTDYGVTITNAPNTEDDGEFNGYAWSNELGTISFRGNVGTNLEYGAQIKPPTVVINSNPLSINVDENPLPQNVSLTWTVTNSTSCVKSGGWSGTETIPSLLSQTKTESVGQSSGSETYRLTCSGPGGTTTGEVSVATFCNEDRCGGSGTCDATPQYGVLNKSVCDAMDTCSDDSDCVPREIGGWKEVSP